MNLKRELKRYVKTPKSNYEENISKDTAENSKSLYKYVSMRKPSNSNIKPLIDENGSILFELLEITTISNY